MAITVIAVIYGLFLVVGGIMGFRKGSAVSLVMGTISGLLVFLSAWLMVKDLRGGLVLLSCVSFLLIGSSIGRLMKTKKFMPSGLILIFSVQVFALGVLALSKH